MSQVTASPTPSTGSPDLLRMAEWVANALLIGGAILISIVPLIALSWPVFAAFLSGHAIWVAAAVIRGNSALLWLNGSMLALDLYAIIVRI